MWARPHLAARDRSLATVACLIMGGSTDQLEGHLELAQANGLTETELTEVITHLAFYAGWPRAVSAMTVAKRMFATTPEPRREKANDHDRTQPARPRDARVADRGLAPRWQKGGKSRMTLKIGIAGVTGWTGRAVAEAVLAADDLSLVAGVSRSAAGQDLGLLLIGEPNGVQVMGSVEEALGAVEVLIDYTAHDAVREHTLTAIGRGVSVVVGTSGLTAADYDAIDTAASQHGVGVVAAGNFSLTAALAQAAALLAARHLPSWEVIDYASETKPDAPSGTAQELAERLTQVRDTAGSLAGCRDRRPDRGTRRQRGRRPSPLRSATGFHAVHRGGLRTPRRTAHHPP